MLFLFDFEDEFLAEFEELSFLHEFEDEFLA